MRNVHRLALIHDLEFQNLSERKLSLDAVHERIIRFMKQDPRGVYRFMIGTDCQVHKGYTKFVTGVVIQRVGKGAWACYRQVVVPRAITSVKEKLSAETAFSEEIAWHFSGARRAEMENVVLPHVYQGASFEAYLDVDAGTDAVRNRTARYVREMVLRAESMGMKIRLKPDAVVASSYANRHTKQPVPGMNM